MQFEWDEAKDAANRAKHGIGLAEAAELDWIRAKFVIDERADYGEIRVIAYAVLLSRLHTCVFTLRNDTARIISLRKSNSREIRDHGTTTETTLD